MAAKPLSPTNEGNAPWTGSSDQLMLERIEQLRLECLRLDRQAGSIAREHESIRANLLALLSSWTWRLMRLAHGLAVNLRVLPRRITAWENLESRLRIAPARGATIEGLHAQSATVRENLHRFEHSPLLEQAPKPLPLRVVGAGLPQTIGESSPSLVEVEHPGPDAMAITQPGAWLMEIESGSLPVGVKGALLDTRRRAALSMIAPLTDARRLASLFDAVGTTEPAEGLPAAHWVVDTPLSRRRFATEAALAGRRREIGVSFIEGAYLQQNPDLQAAIESGEVASGKEHWRLIGNESFLKGARRYRPRLAEVEYGLRIVEPDLLELANQEFASWDSKPLISVLVPIYRPELRWLVCAVNSVTRQIYPHWQLCLVDDGSQSTAIDNFLEQLSDPRISVLKLTENIGVSAASNRALEQCRGQYVALLDHDDELSPDALWLAARTIREHDPDLIYSDEAKIDHRNRIVEPHFKPGFSREQIQSQNYISHLGVYRRDILLGIGGFHPGYEGSQDYDMLLRFLQRAKSVFHIPRVLYFWRKTPQSTASKYSKKDYAWEAGARALEEIQASTIGAKVALGKFPGTYRVKYPIRGNPKVSIIIPFRDRPKLLRNCLRSILATTEYQEYEILGVDNRSSEKTTRDEMSYWKGVDSRISFVAHDDAFNFSAIVNQAAERVTGDHLLLLNNDIEVIDPQWLSALLEFSQRSDVGAVGGLLLYPNNSIQHAGVILGIGGVAGHSHKYGSSSRPGYFCRPHLIQNVSAVTGACLMVKRELLLAIGGLDDQHLSVAFSDVDFCLRLGEFGFLNVYTPYCRLYHHESRSRGPEDTIEKQRRFSAEVNYMLQRHVVALSVGDMYYNPNLTLHSENFSVRQSSE